jgi:AsmA protein
LRFQSLTLTKMGAPLRLSPMRPTSRKAFLVVGSVLLALVVGGAIGLSALDSVLLKQARAQASAYGEKLGRSITIGDVSVKLLFGPSVRVSQVEIGPASGEKLPLLSVKRADVKPALFKVLTSRGKQMEIASATVEGLAINVVRFTDGTTNIQRLQSRIAEGSRPEPEKTKEATQSAQPLNLQLDHFTLVEGVVRFLEQAQAQSRSTAEPRSDLEVRHIDVQLDNLKAEKSLDVSVKAAILAEQRNFELKLSSAPLPASLIPTPKRLVLKIQPIDLKPLAPYLPRSIGLLDGRLSADLTADLGALAPGGNGEARLRGLLDAGGLRWAGSEAGKPLDASLEVDVRGDAGKGNLQIDKLKLIVGPAAITGAGRVLDFASGQPRVQGLEVVAHDFDLARIAALCPPLQRQLKGQIAGPIGLEVRGAGTEASQAIEVKLDLTPVRLALPQVMSKAAGKTMTMLAHVRGAAAGTLRFDLQADLAGVDLRPGESLDKPPGEPLALSISGTKSGNGDKSTPLKIQISEATAHIRDSTATASGSIEHSGSGQDKKTQFELSVHSPRLDLDKLLMSSKKQTASLDPSLFTGLRGHATAKIDSLRKTKVDFSNVVADVKIIEDEVTVQTFSMGAFGGKISADGATLHLARRKMPFHIAARAENVDVAQALTIATERKLVTGKLNGKLNLAGTGTDKDDLIHSLSGSVDGHLLDARFLGRDLVASISNPLAKALPFGLGRAKSEGAGTSLGKDVPFSISVENGFAKLKAPLHISTPEAELTLSGGAHLDGNLDLAGIISLAPSTVLSLTGGKVAPGEAIPIALKIVGPASSPTVIPVDMNASVAAIAKQAGASALGRLLGTGTGGGGQGPQKKEQQQKDAVDEREKARKQAEETVEELLKGLRR